MVCCYFVVNVNEKSRIFKAIILVIMFIFLSSSFGPMRWSNAQKSYLICSAADRLRLDSVCFAHTNQLCYRLARNGIPAVICSTLTDDGYLI